MGLQCNAQKVSRSLINTAFGRQHFASDPKNHSLLRSNAAPHLLFNDPEAWIFLKAPAKS